LKVTPTKSRQLTEPNGITVLLTASLLKAENKAMSAARQTTPCRMNPMLRHHQPGGQALRETSMSWMCQNSSQHDNNAAAEHHWPRHDGVDEVLLTVSQDQKLISGARIRDESADNVPVEVPRCAPSMLH
jgi:hypothetical protein